MTEFTNRNLYPSTEPEYFYMVSEHVTTFGKDQGKNEPIDHEETFKGNNLVECQTKARLYYYDRLLGLEKAGKYFLPFASPKDFKSGENAAYSITLSLVEYYNDEDFILHVLEGEDEETTNESKETELMVLKN